MFHVEHFRFFRESVISYKLTVIGKIPCPVQVARKIQQRAVLRLSQVFACSEKNCM